MGKAGEVTNFGNDSCGNNGPNAFERLQSLQLLCPGRSRQELADLILDLCLACFIMFESIEVSLERYLLRGESKLPVPKPPAMTRAPWLALKSKVVA
jgi:hypothetical protein